MPDTPHMVPSVPSLWLPLALALVLLGPAFPAAAAELHYVTYAAGFRVLDVAADIDLSPEEYRLVVAMHTVGLFSAIVSGRTTTEVTGHWDGLAAVPQRYDVHGTWRGAPLRTVMDYSPQGPQITALVPNPDPDFRDVVPPSLQAGTVDTLSGMAALVHQIASGGGCSAHMHLFDGRRLSDITATQAGTEELDPTSRSVFHGPALRCDFTGHLLAGFPSDEDPARAARAKTGTAWFAPIVPGGPALPVRITFETRFFGHATMYLASAD